MKFLALARGRPVARLLAEDDIDAVLFVHRGGVPGAHDVIGDNAYSEGDFKATEARLIAAFQEDGLSEKEAKIAARGRERDRPIRDFLPIIRVPHQSATAGSSSTAARISEGESQERDRRSLDLREPTWTDRELDGLAQLVELGTITEGGQDLGATPPTAWAQLLNFPQPDGSVLYQWRVPTCPLCQQRHFIPDPPTTEDPKALLGEQAMPCRQGVAVLTDAATNPPPDRSDLYSIATKTEAARDRDELAEAEERLYALFRAEGLSETAARVAARGRR